jgi:hypothetical protein
MKRHELYRIIIGLSLFITLFTTDGRLHSVLAHGPDTSSQVKINNEKFGPYILLVAISPDPAIVGEMDVWVRVAEGETDRLLRDAVVVVEAAPRSGGPTVTAQATHEHAGNAFDYVAHVDVEESGQWDFVIYVEDEPGSIDIAFTETVTGESNVVLLLGLAALFVALATGIGLYLWQQSAVT